MLGTALPASAATETIYNSIPETLASNFTSLSYQAQQTAEFGDQVTLGGTNRKVDSIQVALSSWACETGSWQVVGAGSCATTPATTFNHPITLNIYNINATDATLPGTLIAKVTKTFAVPFRPTTDPVNCASGTQWFNGTSCFNGFGFTIDFDFTASNVVLPDNIIVTVSYNTQTYGESPMAIDGPYSSLNVGESLIAPSVGNEDNTRVFWNTQRAANYNDGGATGTLREAVNRPQTSLLMTIKASAVTGPAILAATGSGSSPAATDIGSSLAATGVDSASMIVWAWIGGGVIVAGIGLFVLAAVRRKRTQND